MKLVVDAQLPRRLAQQFIDHGHDAVHTADLPARNRTPDAEILRLSESEGRIVVTKDSDFVESFLLRGQPGRLLLISTGNITNDALVALIGRHMARIVVAFEGARFVEIDRSTLTVHA